MPVLRTLVLVLIAALFAVGGAARVMPAAVAEPPCHESPADPGKAALTNAAMTCCVGCMPAPTAAAVILRSLPAQRADYAAVDTAIEGRPTAPDPEPPRRRV